MSENRFWLPLASALVALSCGACSSPGAGATGRPEKVTAAPAPTTTATTSARSASPVEGTWRVGPLPMSVIVTNLTAHHLKRWTSRYLGARTGSSTFIYTLKIQNGHLLLLSTIDGVTQGVEDRENYTMAADHITFAPINSGCGSTFRWQVNGEHLALTFVEDTCPPYKGTPDEVFIRALYSSAPYLKITT